MSYRPAPVDRRPRPGRGFLFAWLVPVLLAAAAFVGISLAFWINSGLTGGARAVGWVGAAAVLSLVVWLGRRSHRYGRRLGARDATEALRRDPRPPVVLLRSFADDETRFRPSFKRGEWTGAVPARTYEEMLASILQPSLGPVVAIGDPRDRLPDLGAARMYLPNEEWQGAVLDLLQRAQLVIVHAGDTEGLLWETARVVELVPPDKVLLSLPRAPRHGVDRARYASFRAASSSTFPRPLPEEIADAELVCFEADWTPRLLTRSEFKSRRRVRFHHRPREQAISALAQTFEDKPFLYWYRVVILVIAGIAFLWILTQLS
jgi:hypothetical protein